MGPFEPGVNENEEMPLPCEGRPIEDEDEDADEGGSGWVLSAVLRMLVLLLDEFFHHLQSDTPTISLLINYAFINLHKGNQFCI